VVWTISLCRMQNLGLVKPSPSTGVPSAMEARTVFSASHHTLFVGPFALRFRLIQAIAVKTATDGCSKNLRCNRPARNVFLSAVAFQLVCFSWTSAHAQQRADKSGALCHADGIHIGKHNPRLRERFTHGRHDLPQMFARRQLRHDPAVFPVYIDLRRHEAGQNFSPVSDQRRRRLIARRFNPKHFKIGNSGWKVFC